MNMYLLDRLLLVLRSACHSSPPALSLLPPDRLYDACSDLRFLDLSSGAHRQNPLRNLHLIWPVHLEVRRIRWHTVHL